MPGLGKRNICRLNLLTVCLILSLLNNGRLALSSQVFMTLEDYIEESKIIFTGKAIEKSNEPIKTMENKIGQTNFYALKIEVSDILKGTVSSKHVNLVYPVTKLPPNVHTTERYRHTELEDMGKERIWFLDESVVEESCYGKVAVYELSKYSLVKTTLGILQLSESEQVKELIKMLESDNISFRHNAVQMLGRRNANEAIKPLFALLDTSNEDMRYDIYWAIVKINDEAGNLKLIQALEYNLKNNIDLDMIILFRMSEGGY